MTIVILKISRVILERVFCILMLTKQSSIFCSSVVVNLQFVEIHNSDVSVNVIVVFMLCICSGHNFFFFLRHNSSVLMDASIVFVMYM